MPLVPKLSDIELSFRAGFLDIPLEPLAEGEPKPAAEPGSGPIEIRGPDLGDALQLLPIRDLAIREILAHAESGRARVHLPLPRAEMSFGPLNVDLTRGHEAIVDLVVAGAHIVREQTKGTIEPPISLPLGLRFRGLYLDDDGNIIADITNFPDVNLTKWAKQVPRIPTSLEEALGEVFGRDDDESEASAEPDPKRAKDDDDGPGLDLSGLRVEARDVTTRAEALHLGKAGDVELGAGTKLDVDYSRRSLAISGHVEVAQAVLEGQGFSVRGATAAAQVQWSLTSTDEGRVMNLKVSELAARGEHVVVVLRDGSRLQWGPVAIERGSLTLDTNPKSTAIELDFDPFHAQLVNGKVFPSVAGKPCELHISPTSGGGRVRLAQGRLHLAVDLEEVALEVPYVEVPLAVAPLVLRTLATRGRGKVEGDTKAGFGFQGQIEATAQIAGTQLHAEALSAELAEGSRAEVGVSSFEAGREGLRSLVGSARLQVHLHSGSIPVGPNARLAFDQGATGSLVLDTLSLDRQARWPRLEGSLHVEATSAPVAIERLVRLPAGQAKVDAKLTVDPSGHLQLRNVETSLRSTERDEVGSGS